MKKRGSSLFSILAAVVIIMIATVFLMNGGMGGGKSSRADGKGTTTMGAAKYRAKDQVCQSDMGQLRQGIMLFQTSNDAFPETLEETKLGATFYQCPVGKERYKYDPQTGQVSCPHPGHERY